MLRLSHQEQQHAQDFQQLHLDARREAFGTLFRSPTVWEDLLKSILLCNCGSVGLAAARTSVQHAHKCLACMHVQSWLHLQYSC